MLTQDEKKVLAQALSDYMEGIERADITDKDKHWCEDNVSSIERKLLADDSEVNMTVVTLVINEKDYKNECGEDFSDEVLVSFGREANSVAGPWLGYEGWILRRGDRYVFAPEETQTGY